MIRHSLPTNRNLETGVAFGYISSQSLHPDVVDRLQMDGTDVYYKEGLIDFLEGERAAAEAREDDAEFDEDAAIERFNDSYEQDEPVHEGEYEGVKYRTSWLGGALNVWCFFSPHIGRYRQCSPCVPGAGDLNSPDPDGIECYDVPPSWRDDER